MYESFGHMTKTIVNRYSFIHSLIHSFPFYFISFLIFDGILLKTCCSQLPRSTCQGQPKLDTEGQFFKASWLIFYLNMPSLKENSLNVRITRLYYYWLTNFRIKNLKLIKRDNEIVDLVCMKKYRKINFISNTYS